MSNREIPLDQLFARQARRDGFNRRQKEKQDARLEVRNRTTSEARRVDARPSTPPRLRHPQQGGSYS